jgi:AcrR family transcriptional regulator
MRDSPPRSSVAGIARISAARNRCVAQLGQADHGEKHGRIFSADAATYLRVGFIPVHTQAVKKSAPRPAAANPSPWSTSRQKTRQLKREAVILAAARAFREHGYHNTSLEDVAAALNVTKPTIYYYVANKEEILFECFRTGLDQIKSVFGDLTASKDCARDKLLVLIGHYGSAIAGEFGWCMVRAEDQDLSPVMSRRIKGLKSEIDQRIRALLREGMKDRSIQTCDPKMTAFAIAGALNWISHWYHKDASLNPIEVGEAFRRVFENTLMPR